MRSTLTLVASLLLAGGFSQATTLREAVQSAGPAGGYDRWVELEPGEVYTGGLLIGPIFLPYSDQPVGPPGEDVRIVGNGAVLDLQGGRICISYCNNRLDISDCVILDGDVRFRGYDPTGLMPAGSVSQVTFWMPQDYGVKVILGDCQVTLERNLIVDAVDTGWDFLYLTGIPSDWLPTGMSIACGYGGGIDVRENWSYHSDPLINADPLAHFAYLCPYG